MMDVSTLTQRALPRLKSLIGALPEILVPGTCLTCDRYVGKHGGCCPKCWQKLRFISQPFCEVTGIPFSVSHGEGAICTEALANPPPFERLRAVMLYDDLARKLISGIKYSDRSDLIPWVAKWMSVSGQELIKDTDVIIPIPLHHARLRARRFNQSGELSRLIAKQNHIEFYPELLIRRKATQQQVGLNEKQRERNVSGAFNVPLTMKSHLKGRHVLLVDDVYTTGATVKAATRALKRGGAKKIDVLVFAKVETYDL